MVRNLLSFAQILFVVCMSSLCLLACRPSSSQTLSPAVETSPGPGPTPTCYLLPQPTGEKYSPALIETSPPAQAAPGQAVTVRFSGGYGIIFNNARICGEETVGYIFSDELPSFSTQRTVQLLFGGQQLATAECDRDCEITALIPAGTLPGIYRLELQITTLFEETYFDIQITEARPNHQSPTAHRPSPTSATATPTVSQTTVPSPTPVASLATPETFATLINTPTPLLTADSPPPIPTSQIELVESNKIWGLAWSPDGKTLAIASSIIWLYDLTNPQTSSRVLQGYNSYVKDIAFSPDGTMLAAAHHGGGLYLWDMNTKTGVAVLENSDLTNTNSIAFSPDGTTLAVGNSLSNGGFVQLVDPQTQTEKHAIDQTHWVQDVALSNDYLAVVVAGRRSGGLSLLNLHTGESPDLDVHCDLFLPASLTSFDSMAFSPDGSLFAFGITAGNYAGTTGAVQIWDLKQGECRGSLSRYDHGSDNLAFSPDGSLLATSDGRSIRLWNSQTLIEVMEIHPQVSNRSSFTLSGLGLFTFSPDGSRLAFVDGNTVQLIALPPDLATNPHPSALKRELLIVDNFGTYPEDQLQANYRINTGGRANQGSFRLENRETGPVLALDYVINETRPDNYVMAEQCFVPEQNWQNGRYLEMWIENDEHPKLLTVQFGEGQRCADAPFGGEVWVTQVHLPAGVKGMVSLPLKDKLFFTRAGWSPQQNDQFDLEKIGHFAVGFKSLESNSSGTVYIGPARLWP